MADLKDVVGAVLKDLAQSRVISDQFSSEVSRQYEQDPLLGTFPVPRVEIKEASITLKFVVNAVSRAPVDLSGVTRGLAQKHAREIASELFREHIEKHPNGAEIIRFAESKEWNLEQRFQSAAESVLADPAAAEAARTGSFDALGKQLGAELSNILLEDADLKRLLLSRGQRVGVLREAIQSRANTAAARFGEQLAAAYRAAEQQALKVDVAVTARELADVPESRISQITITTAIRNYEWVEVGLEDEKPLKQLRPE